MVATSLAAANDQTEFGSRAICLNVRRAGCEWAIDDRFGRFHLVSTPNRYVAKDSWRVDMQRCREYPSWMQNRSGKRRSISI